MNSKKKTFTISKTVIILVPKQLLLYKTNDLSRCQPVVGRLPGSNRHRLGGLYIFFKFFNYDTTTHQRENKHSLPTLLSQISSNFLNTHRHQHLMGWIQTLQLSCTFPTKCSEPVDFIFTYF